MFTLPPHGSKGGRDIEVLTSAPLPPLHLRAKVVTHETTSYIGT